MRCSSLDPLLNDYLDGTLALREEALVREHIATCASCAEMLAEVREVDALLVTPQRFDPAPDLTPAIMTRLQALPAPCVRRGSFVAFLGIYLALCWSAAFFWLLSHGDAAAATLAAVQTVASRGLEGFRTTARIVGHLFGHAAPSIMGVTLAILLVDFALAVAAVAGVALLRNRQRRIHPFSMLLLCLTAAFAACAIPADAHTYRHSETVLLSHLTLSPNDEVDGDLTIVLGSATCTGAVIHGDVRTLGGAFHQLDNCRVDGDVTDLLQSDSVQAYLPWAGSDAASAFDPFDTRAVAIRQLGYDVIVLVVFLLFPVRVRVAMERVERHPGLCAVTGALAMAAVVPVAIMLLLTIVGIPLILLEGAALLAGVWIGQGAIAVLVGRRFLELIVPTRTPSPMTALLVGLLIVSAAEIAPFVGWAVVAVTWLVGLGATILGFASESAFHAFLPVPTNQESGNPPAVPQS